MASGQNIKSAHFESKDEINVIKKPRKKKIKKDENVSFSSSVDPYDYPLRWWEVKPLKYA